MTKVTSAKLEVLQKAMEGFFLGIEYFLRVLHRGESSEVPAKREESQEVETKRFYNLPRKEVETSQEVVSRSKTSGKSHGVSRRSQQISSGWSGDRPTTFTASSIWHIGRRVGRSASPFVFKPGFSVQPGNDG